MAREPLRRAFVVQKTRQMPLELAARGKWPRPGAARCLLVAFMALLHLASRAAFTL